MLCVPFRHYREIIGRFVGKYMHNNNKWVINIELHLAIACVVVATWLAALRCRSTQLLQQTVLDCFQRSQKYHHHLERRSSRGGEELNTKGFMRRYRA